MAVKMLTAPDMRVRHRARAQYSLHCIGFLFVFAFAKPVVHASCKPGYYGERCDLPCNCADHSENCDHEGFCSSGCRAGYHGNGCMEKCSMKTYGVDCAEKCECGEDCPCDPVTGSCIYAECKHPAGSSGASKKTGVWITVALLGLVVFFVATALLLNCKSKSGKVSILKKLKMDSLEKYRRRKKNSSDSAQTKTNDETINTVFISSRQPDDNPAKHREGDHNDIARDDGGRDSGPEPNTLMQTKQRDPCKDNTHLGDSITGDSFESGKKRNKRNVLYVPQASLLREAVHAPVYENVPGLKGRRFKTFESPELAEDSSDSTTMLQMETLFPNQDAAASLPQTKMLPADHRSSAVICQRLSTVPGVCSPQTNVPGDGAKVIHDLRIDESFAEQPPWMQTVGLFPDRQTRRKKDNFTQPSDKRLEADRLLPSDQPKLTESHKDIQEATPASLYDTEAISPTGIQVTNVSPTYVETDELLQQKSMSKQSQHQYANRQDSPNRSYIETGKQHTSIPRKCTKYGPQVGQYHIKLKDSTKQCAVREESLKTKIPTYHAEKKECRDTLNFSTQSSFDSPKSESDPVCIQEDDIYESCIDTESSSEALTTQNGYSQQPDAEIKPPAQPSPKRRVLSSGVEVTEQTFSVQSHAVRSSSPTISTSTRSKSPQQRPIVQKLLSPKSFEKSTSHAQQQSQAVPHCPSSPDISTQPQLSPQTDRLSASLTRDIGNMSEGEGKKAGPLSGNQTFPLKSGDESVSPIPPTHSLTHTTSTPHVVCRLCKPPTNVTADNETERTGEQNLPVQTSPISCKTSQGRLKSTDTLRDPGNFKTTRAPAEVATKETSPAPSPAKDSQQMLPRSDTSRRSLNTLRTPSRTTSRTPSRSPSRSTPRTPSRSPSRSPPQYTPRGPPATPRRLLHGPRSPQKPTLGLPSNQHCLLGTPSPRQSARDTPSPRQPAHDPSLQQPSPTRTPRRCGRVGTKGGNCEAFEHTHYHLLGTSAYNVQETGAPQSATQPAVGCPGQRETYW